MQNRMKILYFGDIIGTSGLNALKMFLDNYEGDPHFIFVNGENVAGGRGITRKEWQKLKEIGVDGASTGNHIFDRRETYGDLKTTPEIIRPLNYPTGTPGKGYHIFKKGDRKVGVISACGRVYMKDLDCPFRRIDAILQEIREETDAIIVDIHGEATGEKKALGYFLDGKVTAVLGTHTHTQTNDAGPLPKGTLFMTDLGMVGARESIIGTKKDIIVNHFLTGLPFRVEVENEGPMLINGIEIEVAGGVVKEFSLIKELI